MNSLPTIPLFPAGQIVATPGASQRNTFGSGRDGWRSSWDSFVGEGNARTCPISRLSGFDSCYGEVEVENDRGATSGYLETVKGRSVR
jgi:hypothetical protein